MQGLCSPALGEPQNISGDATWSRPEACGQRVGARVRRHLHAVEPGDRNHATHGVRHEQGTPRERGPGYRPLQLRPEKSKSTLRKQRANLVTG